MSLFSPGDDGVLRLITAGSVDDGKSTLIGRLLYDSKNLLADQLSAIEGASARGGAPGTLDLSLITDGLESERAQGITIDVAYRYFSTPRRKFIIADAPGHEQYTRNMVTGASTAQVAIVLIDATRVTDGELLIQTRRHSTIAHLLGIEHIVVAVNKMDLVDWDESIYRRIADAYSALATSLGIGHFHILPISALLGENVCTLSARTPWYAGPPLLALLEALPLQPPSRQAAFRLAVQWVIRSDGSTENDFRGWCGRIDSGELAVGDAIQALPSGVTARVNDILRAGVPVQRALQGDSVTVTLDRDVDISRGDVLAAADRTYPLLKQAGADLCWLDTTPLNPARKYLLKHGTRTTLAKISGVHTRRDMQTLLIEPNVEGTLAMNDIGSVSLGFGDALPVEPYTENPAAGAFILIDPASYQTAAAGMFRTLPTGNQA